MAKFITKKVHPKENKQIVSFVKRFEKETDHKVHLQFVQKEVI